jgi:hypothetical protein
MNAQAEFQSRRTEVDEYLAHLSSMEGGGQVSVTLMNTMKSSALLMIYNNIESTMSNLLQDLFDHLESSNATFDSLNQVMRQVVLSQVKRGSPKLIVERMNAPLGFVAACFDKTGVFSGNLDSKVIRETLRELGVAGFEKHKEKVLLKVKNERNSLAHGNKSFSDCGKNYSTNDLVEIQHKTCAALEKVVRDIESFLTTESYR